MKYCKPSSTTLTGLIILALIVPFLPFSASRAEGTPLPLKTSSSVAAGPEGNQPLQHGCGGAAPAPTHPVFEQEVVRLVNLERAARSIPPLKRSASLDQAARYHAEDLGMDDYFSHDSYDRDGADLVYVCSPWNRIASYYDGARGENIAAGYTTPESVVAAWMESDGHRFNILSTSSREIGVGYYEGNGGYNTYWTQDFGTQHGMYPIIINNDALETNDPLVDLYIYGDFDQIRLKNNAGDWSEWQPFQSSLQWQLPLLNGEHTVYAEMRNPGQTAYSQDTIILTGYAAQPELNDLADTITFTYFTASGRLFPSAARLTPENIGSSDPLVWKVDIQGDWLSVTPEGGVTPESFTVSAAALQRPLEAVEQGLLTLTVTSPTDTLGSPHVINVTMNVVSGTLSTVFIPLIINPVE